VKRHFEEELKQLQEKLFRMGLLVEEAIRKATEALLDRDSRRAQDVIRNDQEINLQEIEIDEMGHEFIALHQPAAADLRLITMMLKINNDLERMADQAVNIAEKAIVINQEPPFKASRALIELSQASLRIVRDALDAFIEVDPAKARDILERDDQIDDLNDRLYDELQNLMQEHPEHVRAAVSLIMISHNLERIGDLATNIAEDVIYVKRGVDVRHHIRERREDQPPPQDPRHAT